METPLVEPWLLGPISGFDPVISHLLRAGEHILSDIDRWFGSVADGRLWSTATGFHLKHLAGSTGRLCTYLAGEPLNAEQISEIPLEHQPSPDLVPNIHRSFARYEAIVKSLTAREFDSLRYIGRQKIPVTAISLAIHIVEHGQRHLGQAISSFATLRV